ncbi:MAG TPA: YbfB/YjiJ family MFS transporter [Nevskiaceae bacterium]|nr:YbfB/YjiJ family MFS transporter [Nevskiaceae bacterium]
MALSLNRSRQPGPWLVAISGLTALAVAMGIGRFAFTPILPMMQADAGVTIASAGWLAAANYLGYFLGALVAARLPTVGAIRGGLVVIAVVTFAMGLTTSFPLWLVLRLVAGVGSAAVLVHVSAWGLERLSQLGRSEVNGLVFSGVGVGIAVAGLVCMVLMASHISSAHAWECFGLLSIVFCAVIWRVFGAPSTAQRAPAAAVAPVVRSGPSAPHRGRLHWTRDRVRLAACYGAFGFGYIVPATFLPAMARHYITNPFVFGWAWPVFGAAAALSTWAVARWLRAANDRKVWAVAYVLMAIGVALPVAAPGLPAIILSALLVGSTFMLATMLGLREARRVAGSDATQLIAALTAAFAFLQVVGPLVVSGLDHVPHGFAATLLAAAVVLVVGAWVLWSSARSTRMPWPTVNR